jgi:predicted nucleotidyltransferase
VGTARIVRVDETSPIHDELSGLVMKTLGPPVALAAALADLSGIEEAFIFGSWASRMLGQFGPVPADIDLLVVGVPDRRALNAACARAGATLGREVQATVVSPGDWDPPRTGFLKSLHDGSLVRLGWGAPVG